jgi:glutamate synthase (ferredoxin)
MMEHARPQMGLYQPRFERDACGIGFVADAAGRASHGILQAALEGLYRVRHRGAVAADQRSGDGAGLLLPLPRAFFTQVAHALGAPGAAPARLGVAMVFLPGTPGVAGEAARAAARRMVEAAAKRAGLELLAWRPVPIDARALGEAARATAPGIEQALFVYPDRIDADEAERRAYLARRRAEAAARADGNPLYIASWSFRTVTYKAMCAADQLAPFYHDLRDARVEVPFCIFHQRYSTNTSPSWERAQPFRLLCHNGEINAIQGNVNAMHARGARLGATFLDEDTALGPLVDETGSDSAMLDNALELLIRGGRDVRHSLAMLVPEAWEGMPDLHPQVRAFYRYHASLVEPWDGPAGLIFTDGVRVGAALDRNGLRPLRLAICEDGFVACCSEAGAVVLDGHGAVQRRRLGPGRMVCVDPGGGGVQLDTAIKARLGEQRPYARWIAAHLRHVDPDPAPLETPADLVVRQAAFGYTKEEFTYILRPMAMQGKEPTSSMGDDTPPATLVTRPRPLYHYFKQRFAQVTNPAIDHLRERLVMSLRTCLGPRDPLLWERPEAVRQLELETFLLAPATLEAVVDAAAFPVARLDATFPLTGADLEGACARLAAEAEHAVLSGAGILIISDRRISPERAPIPALLALGSVRQRLVNAGLRALTSLVVETDEAREVHHFACLLGYGAEAVCPPLVLQSLAALAQGGRLSRDQTGPAEAQQRFFQAVEDGVLKVLSKMGISTLDSYRGAGIFEALGLSPAVIERCFAGTPSPIGGADFAELERDVRERHAAGFAVAPKLESPGFYKHHKAGTEYHANHPGLVDALHDSLGIISQKDTSAEATDAPEPVAAAPVNGELRAAHALQRAVKASSNGHGYELYQRFAELVSDRPPTEPRDLLELLPAGPPVPLEEVEPVSAIVRRFSTGAMSHGSIAAEAHETLAIAMNRLGGKSNTGEGGEDPARYRTRGQRDDRNSRIKQVASGRFGVTPEYCAFADELQIKIAQGSKPGEGGQLPAHKATEEIARLRHTQPGIALISPPPHHDIYSIEDLAQLIYDLKQVNPQAEVSVKLVAEVGVGTIAAGVTKGLADIVHIAGAAGGTGASPLSSIKHVGLPWELGLAETQQTLMRSELRGRVRIRVDGSLKSGRDIVMAALLGADEYSFGTAALLAEGCIMVRTCHLDTCPTGIATQRPELRAKYAGTPEMVMRYLTFVAEDVRRILASLGLRTIDEAVGRTDLLRQKTTGDARADALDLSPLLLAPVGTRRFVRSLPWQRPASALGDQVCADALPTLRTGRHASLRYAIQNGDRAVGARLGGLAALEFGAAAPPGRVTVAFEGQAGQSFGAFLVAGVEFILTGEANDYVGKGMGGGRILIRPPANDAGQPCLLGNTVLYGATGGELFAAGRAGERFAVRNSGALAVVEGTGDHACEYMTGGTVVVLGPVGRNLGAGMTGGEAFVCDPEVEARMNGELVRAEPVRGEAALRLRSLLQRHLAGTGSERARQMLADWSAVLPTFRHVIPNTDVARIESAHEGTLVGRA